MANLRRSSNSHSSVAEKHSHMASLCANQALASVNRTNGVPLAHPLPEYRAPGVADGSLDAGGYGGLVLSIGTLSFQEPVCPSNRWNSRPLPADTANHIHTQKGIPSRFRLRRFRPSGSSGFRAPFGRGPFPCRLLMPSSSVESSGRLACRRPLGVAISRWLLAS